VLREAAADVVVGPCDGGGDYLIGLRAPAPALFAGMPWSTAMVTEETLARARRLGLRLALPPSWFDVDGGEDLRASGPRRRPRILTAANTRLLQAGRVRS
jgi:glycosyltransferase A (GT-A) superfamily protein (DUF2064 family)